MSTICGPVNANVTELSNFRLIWWSLRICCGERAAECLHVKVYMHAWVLLWAHAIKFWCDNWYYESLCMKHIGIQWAMRIHHTMPHVKQHWLNAFVLECGISKQRMDDIVVNILQINWRNWIYCHHAMEYTIQLDDENKWFHFKLLILRTISNANTNALDFENSY